MRIGAWLGGLALAAVGIANGPAQAQKSEDTLRVTWREAIPDVDPYYNRLRSGLVLAHQAWDCLTYRDPETFQIRPLLATAWRYVDPTTLEFDLRHGVTFHDGSPFSADDVVYTVNTVLADKQVAVPSNYAFIAGADKVDDYKVRIRLKRVSPAALEYISMVLPIWPKAYRERVGADAYAEAPVGAGPYRIAKVDGVTQISLERYPGYYADSAKGRPAIGKVVIREVSDASTELSDLLGERADWIWKIAPDVLDNLARDPRIATTRAESMRVAYMQFDAAGRSGAGNPLTNVKVRQAIAHAIDRQTIARELVGPGSRVPDAPCFPTQFGCDATAAARYDYDPAKAKSLLGEAGFPHGFSTEIVSYFLPQHEAAVQSDLRAVGIEAHITHLQVGAALQRTLAGGAPIGLADWGSYSINDVSAFMPSFFSGGASDYTRDPDVVRLVEQGGSTTDTDKRRAAYSEAIRKLTEDADFLPLYTGVVTYAFSKLLVFKPFPDELPRFFLASWR